MTGCSLRTEVCRPLEKLALDKGMRLLRDDGIRVMREGLTTAEEVLRLDGGSTMAKSGVWAAGARCVESRAPIDDYVTFDLGLVGLMWAGAVQGLATLARVRRPTRVLLGDRAVRV